MSSAAAERRREVARAGHSGDMATARAAFADSEAAVRATALGALERIGVLGDVELAAGLKDPDSRVRRRAAELAARHPGVSLFDALHDTDVTVVEMAAWACGEQLSPDAAPQELAADSTDAVRSAASAEGGADVAPNTVLGRLIALATDHADALVREAAVASLGAIGDPAGLPAILAGTRDKPAVRRRAVLALAPFDGPEVDAALERARSDRDWQVRQAAEDLSAAGAIWAGDDGSAGAG